jgi:hypothetical protein
LFWGLIALAAWTVWVWAAYRRARVRAGVPRLEVRVVDDTLVLRFDPSLASPPGVRRQGVAVEPAASPPDLWLLRGLSVEAPERVEVSAEGRSWRLDAVRAEGPPVRFVGVSELGRAVLDFRRPVRAGWSPGPAGLREFSAGRHELVHPHPHEWPWELHWQEGGLDGVQVIDPLPVLRRWAFSPHSWARVSRTRRFWPERVPPPEAFAGASPAAPLRTWRGAGLRAIGDPKEARMFDVLFEDWRVMAWRTAEAGAPPEACDDEAPGRPRRVREAPSLEGAVAVEEGSGAGMLAGLFDEQITDLTPPLGTPTVLATYRWPEPPPGELLTLVVGVRPAGPGRWYALTETRPTRGYQLAFPPLVCGEGQGDGPEYLVWEIPADVAPEVGARLVLREYRPDPSSPVGDSAGAELGGLTPPGRGSDAGAGTASRR